ncbi:alkaline ceramidase 2-like protein [Leptotrombidium deliense]|uniref:Alkaline ceramidase n=1 Tax=Leptotrombidium deliense TaxID=299467 RepID=A0A443SG12_9ACAR|nr:alkaline ceramidase 2-like protein [Leptotrombidium deliense]
MIEIMIHKLLFISKIRFSHVSNILLILIPLFSYQFSKNNVLNIKRSIFVASLFVGIVGLFSWYFHATLSLLGQLLDEIAILWAIAASLGLFLPKHRFPNCLQGNRTKLQTALLLITVLTTTMCSVYPWINAFVLMSMAIPIITVLYRELRTCTTSRVSRVGFRSVLLWLIAVGIWISDRIFCSFWILVKFPYLHGFWHILIAITAYYFIVTFAYFRAKSEFRENNCHIKYWPNDKLEMFIPYLVTKHII